MGTQVAPVLCQSLEDIPLEVAVNSQPDVATVNGLLNQLGSPGEANTIGTLLVGSASVDRSETRVIFALHSRQRLIRSEHSGEVCGDRTKRIGALANQVHLQPRVAQLPQRLAVFGADTLHQIGEMCLGVLGDGVEQLIGVSVCDERNLSHRTLHRDDLTVTAELAHFSWVSAHVVAINIRRQIVAKTVHNGPTGSPDNLAGGADVGGLLFELSCSNDLNIYQA